MNAVLHISTRTLGRPQSCRMHGGPCDGQSIDVPTVVNKVCLSIVTQSRAVAYGDFSHQLLAPLPTSTATYVRDCDHDATFVFES